MTNSIDHDYDKKIQNPAFARGKNGEVPIIETKAPASSFEKGTNGIIDPMKELGLDATDENFRLSELKAAGADDRISVVSTSGRQHTIIVQIAYNAHYPAGFSKEDKIPQSELWFQQWKAAKPDDIPSLKYNVQKDIMNTDTQHVIEDANENLNGGKLVKHTKVTLDPNTEVKPGAPNPQKDGFMALTQTDNGRALFRMLSDHKKDFEGLKVVRVHTWIGDEVDEEAEEPQMIWEMSK